MRYVLDANIAIAALNGVDLLIARTAIGHDAILVTNDQGLLDVRIDGLRTENWLAARPTA